MKWKTITKWVIIVSVIIFIIYNIFVAFTSEGGDTISEILRDWGSKLWTIPFYMSILIGHWFINRHKSENYAIIRYLILGTIGISTLMLNLFTNIYIWWYITIPTGLLIGTILWPQEK